MSRTWLALLLLCCCCLFAWAPVALAAEPEPEPEAASVRRFALLVGANDGGGEREMLRFAATDAELFGKALTELGGVASSDRAVLVNPTVSELEDGFRAIQAKISRAKASGARVQFFFYYSGHSDETGLLLGGVHVDYKRLRGLIDKVGAEVRIGILDSCSSGAFTRFKGGKKQAPFVLGGASEVEGHAYLTSSSADEAAQESDRIGGSFFTHFFVTGLRGAADFDGDRQVTLDEAYRFAFDETLARTETTAGGPQHAAYDIQLAGTGELVMTDLRKTSAKLEIADDVTGRIYVRDRRGDLAAELHKPKSAGVVTLALEPGDYSITIDDGHDLHRAEVEVRSHKPALLALAGLEDVAAEGTRLRGASELEPAPIYTHVPFNVGIAPGAEINARFGRATPIHNDVSLSFGVTGAAKVTGVQSAIGAVWTTDTMHGVQAAIGAAIAHGDATGIQTAIGASVTKGHLRGLQLGTFVSLADQLTGMQIGIVNVTRKPARGVQWGLVNVAHGEIEGVQIGLINYADEADASIGLLPITKKGGVAVDAWTSDVQLLNGGIKLRARKTYTLLTAGIHPIGDDSSRSWSLGLGFGGPLLTREHLSLELDNVVAMVNPGGFAVTRSPLLLDSLRLSFAYRPFRHFAIWAGVTANVALDFEPSSDGDYRPGYSWAATLLDPGPDRPGVKLWPGFVIGLEI